MDNNETEVKILESYVNRCIDNIINHELIEGVTDVKSFAEFALPLEFDDERFSETIKQGAEITYKEMSNGEQKKLDSLSCKILYDKEYSFGGVTRRYYEKTVLYAHLYTLVQNRIKQQLKERSCSQSIKA